MLLPVCMLIFLTLTPLAFVSSIKQTFIVLLGILLTNILFSFSSLTLQSSIISPIIQSDPSSFWLIVVTLVIIYISLCIGKVHTHDSYLSYLFLLICSYFVFSTTNLLWLYVFYELSLIPIIYIILKWGTYPDRLSRSVIMLLFTTFFSFPCMVIVLYVSSAKLLPLVTLGDSLPLRTFISILLLMCFAVKLPLYGVHYWLPIAHVEAPTPGRMVLAGILLKLGGLSIIRLSTITSFLCCESILLSYLCFSLVVSSVITSLQPDFKRLVAYSSVVHITILLIPLLLNLSLTTQAVLMIIVFHGLVSPIIFILVGWCYSISQTRLLPLMQGMSLVSYPLSIFLIIAFLINIPTPPFSTFISEVVLFISITTYFKYLFVFALFYIFISIVFNLSWLSSISFGSSNFNLFMSDSTFSSSNLIISTYCCVFILLIPFFSNLF